VFLDLDNSGWLDILAVNGHVYPQVNSARLGATYREPRLLYQNLGDGTFKDISKQSGPGCTEPASSRGLAVADLWNEGRVSAVVNNIDEKPMLLVNLAANSSHWVGTITEGTRSNRDGIGARVTVFASGHRWVQEVRSGSSYLSSNDLRLHFGLGPARSIDHIEVLWPSGVEEIFQSKGVDRFVTLVEGSGSRKASTK
jgi:enediyne biosynthesis protein E4